MKPSFVFPIGHAFLHIASVHSTGVSGTAGFSGTDTQKVFNKKNFKLTNKYSNQINYQQLNMKYRLGSGSLE